MKKISLLLLFLIIVAAGAILPRYTFLRSSNSNSGIASPLPEILTKTFPGVLGAQADYWQPQMAAVESNIAKPHLTAEAVISYDLTTDKLLFERNTKRRLPLASLTKIMTATIALETMKLDDELTVSK